MNYQTEAKPQCWRAVVVFDDRPEMLLYLNRSSPQVRAGYRAAYLDLLEEDERVHVASISIVYRTGTPAGVLSIERGPDGALYFSDQGAIYRLVAT